jgi:hypothetical protein
LKSFNDWQEAAASCKTRKAISDPFSATLPGGRTLNVCIVKPLHGDPEYVYASCPAIKVRELKCTARDCDRIKKWKAW